jgi:phosphoserine phosphatase
MSGPLPQAHVEHLAELLATDRLVLFVGAGISRQAVPKPGIDPSSRMPLWRDLAEKVAQTTGEDVAAYNENILDLFDAVEANQSRMTLEEAVRSAIPENEFEPSAAHIELAKLPWHTVYTTNYDNLLSRVLEEKTLVDTDQKYEWLAREDGHRPRLIHLHGTLDNLGTLTGEDYSLWPDKNPLGSTNLKNVALNKTILFAGYSFSDPHLKSGLLPWIRSAMPGRGKRHLSWMWRINSEQRTLLDKRDEISAFSIESDDDWAKAFAQLNEAWKRRKSSLPPRRKDPIKVSKPIPAPSTAFDRAIVNGYKLYFHRTNRQLSVKHLSQLTGIDGREINNLEQVKTKISASAKCFGSISRENLARLEHALDCIGELEFGRPDDFLATYILFYTVNRGVVKASSTTKQLDFKPQTKAVVFDFGGTLALSNSELSTWERIWAAVGYQIEDAADLHRQFQAKKITHQEWCDLTCEKLRERNFSRREMKTIIDDIYPIAGLPETLQNLHDAGIALYIVSGSIKEIISNVIGDATYKLFSEVKANEFVYDDAGVLKQIRGHQFDFEGKAHFITRVIQEQRCAPLEVLFVGNSLNDSWASRSGARTLCVNPTHVDHSNTLIWTDYIKKMVDLSEIMKFVHQAA